ncbi:galactosylgalactosylxylosylprotein 3-beta-glucuronosyltransferase 1 [Biomphalaria pfeifferi]|uniref:Galactosylgalactosylxylosylprotein 3-beta-glucuronosyltransferase n=1 Tax=Biomphalaria pfeifferi TaxID=112525 RepID=A0AAD8F7T4_BIOPF|nr:galactosylgalactosylxylosylprotein 3-beta-glucuronosyltransferase 1 [Biomphalaria pfeifferi]
MFSTRKFLCPAVITLIVLWTMLIRDLPNKRDNETIDARSLKSLPVIYLITPTYARLEQKAELTQLSHTLLHVPNIHWIVIEDSPEKTALVQNFLNRTRIHSTHLYVATPSEYKMNRTDPHWLKPRGVLQRNAALDWLRNNTSPDDDGVVYFADDDNTYSLQIFEEMRNTTKVSIWPVGLVADLRYERPKVTNGKVTGWYTNYKPDRPFATDMAGFAINLNLIHQHPEAKFSNIFAAGSQESTFLTLFHLTLDDLEPKANMCSEVLVWHTRTERSKTPYEEAMVKLYGADAYPNIEV